MQPTNRVIRLDSKKLATINGLFAVVTEQSRKSGDFFAEEKITAVFD